jgi:hypothetical protein
MMGQRDSSRWKAVAACLATGALVAIAVVACGGQKRSSAGAPTQESLLVDSQALITRAASRVEALSSLTGDLRIDASRNDSDSFAVTMGLDMGFPDKFDARITTPGQDLELLVLPPGDAFARQINPDAGEQPWHEASGTSPNVDTITGYLRNRGPIALSGLSDELKSVEYLRDEVTDGVKVLHLRAAVQSCADQASSGSDPPNPAPTPHYVQPVLLDLWVSEDGLPKRLTCYSKVERGGDTVEATITFEYVSFNNAVIPARPTID